MFSDIPHISSASEPLKAEAVDSRLRNKKGEEGECQNKSSNKEAPAREDDTMSSDPVTRVNEEEDHVNRFSVDSLIYFLEDYLEERITGKVSERGAYEVLEGEIVQEGMYDISTIEPWLRTKHVNSNDLAFSSPPPKRSDEPRNVVAPRYAAHAYAHRAMLNDVSQPMRRRVQQHAVTHSSSPDEKPSEKIRDIYNLIRDLRELKDQGMTHLDVKNDAALLEGISAAVRTDHTT